MNYDAIAGAYDGYMPPWYRAEDAVSKRFTLIQDDVLDIGCGTGGAIDLFDLAPERYLGLDISPRMVAEAKRKHPRHAFAVTDAARMGTIGRYDTLLCLFGSASYFTEPELRAIVKNNLAPKGIAYFHLGGMGRDWTSPGGRMDWEIRHKLLWNTVRLDWEGWLLWKRHINPWNWLPRPMRAPMILAWNPQWLDPKRYSWTYYVARRSGTDSQAR